MGLNMFLCTCTHTEYKYMCLIPGTNWTLNHILSSVWAIFKEKKPLNSEKHTHSDCFIAQQRKRAKREWGRISGYTAVHRLPSEQLEFKLISVWQGPVLGTVDEPVLGKGLLGEKHCCLCQAPLNNSISMVLRLAISWLARTNLL